MSGKSSSIKLSLRQLTFLIFFRVMAEHRSYVQLEIHHRTVTLKVALLRGGLAVMRIIQQFMQMSLWLEIGLTLKSGTLA